MKRTKLSLLLIAGALVLCSCGNTENKSNVDNSSNESQTSLNSEGFSSTNSSSKFTPIGSNSRPTPSKENSSNQQNSSSAATSSSTNPASSSSNNQTTSQSSGDSKWNINISLRGNAFRDRLEDLITAKRKTTISYTNCLTVGAKAAAYPNKDSKTFIPFYHEAKTGEETTTGACNREHTWPNSRGSGKSGAGADPFIIRPTLSAENSARGNNFYGLGSSEWDPASCGFEGARGESARVVLYAATAYHTANGFELSNNPGDSTSMKTMGTLRTLIEWNNKYPVTAMERQINDYLDSQGLGRNPFVDHPEYANYIWNANGIITSEGGDGQDDFEHGMKIFTDYSALSGKSFAMVSSVSSDGPFYSLNNKAKNENTPWYLEGLSVLLNSDRTKMIPTNSSTSIPTWTFTQIGNGTYTIYNPENKCYLTSSINDSHYNVGLTSTLVDDGSCTWFVTGFGSGFRIYSGVNVYFEYYQSSFCGYRSAPSVPIYLFQY